MSTFFVSDPLARRSRSRFRSLAFGIALAFLASQARAAEPETEWQERYARAKTDMVEGRNAQAASALEELAQNAPSPADRKVALELAAVARASAARTTATGTPHIRTSDELSVLYTSAFVYGLGTGAWVVLLTQPENFAGAALPFVAFTGASVAGVAFADGYRPFRRGVPHSMAAGLYLGAGEAIWAIGFQRSAAARRSDGSGWEASGVATALWAGATLGGITGGLVGAFREPTPGRVSFTGSAAIWSGLVTSFTAGAIEADDEKRGEVAFAAGGIAYNLGLVTGVLVAPSVAPSVTRMRFLDLGTLGGGLLGAGTYAVLAQKDSDVRGGFAASAAGMAAGLGLSWWLTDDMPRDTGGGPHPHGPLQPAITPVRGGFMAGISGAL